AQLHPAVALIWILSRTVGAVLIVPIAEELAFRGYLLRKLVSSRFEEVSASRRSLFSFTASSLVFGFLHADWLSGTVAGALFAAAVYWRGRITDAIVAHVVANAALTAVVLGFGRWDL